MAAKAKRILLWCTVSLGALCLAVVLATVTVNSVVAWHARDRVFASAQEAPHRRVALLLGTSPWNRLGRANTYYTNRMRTAAALYHAGKVDYIIASGDNHTRNYDEPTAMTRSLVELGVPRDRIVADYAGFRTLDSVVRAKEVFGCDTLIIITQADHAERALYLAQANGIDAVAVAAPLQAGRKTRLRLTLREWLARDKMMLDIWFGKRPHFLGERIAVGGEPADSI